MKKHLIPMFLCFSSISNFTHNTVFIAELLILYSNYKATQVSEVKQLLNLEERRNTWFQCHNLSLMREKLEGI